MNYLINYSDATTSEDSVTAVMDNEHESGGGQIKRKLLELINQGHTIISVHSYRSILSDMQYYEVITDRGKFIIDKSILTEFISNTKSSAIKSIRRL